ncbi:hypothetical protein CASFOL_030498 [Castilleja foliolosa]|uniref:Uncharacterized protein n=1 Tax=Castilleja foliolosa TaxID=1961234 RepID=A0ABD3BB45_9LAMI
MQKMTVFQRFSRSFPENPSLAKILIVFTVRKGSAPQRYDHLRSS